MVVGRERIAQSRDLAINVGVCHWPVSVTRLQQAARFALVGGWFLQLGSSLQHAGGWHSLRPASAIAEDLLLLLDGFGGGGFWLSRRFLFCRRRGRP
jgi:hypothetical protein